MKSRLSVGSRRYTRIALTLPDPNTGESFNHNVRVKSCPKIGMPPRCIVLMEKGFASDAQVAMRQLNILERTVSKKVTSSMHNTLLLHQVIIGENKKWILIAG